MAIITVKLSKTSIDKAHRDREGHPATVAGVLILRDEVNRRLHLRITATASVWRVRVRKAAGRWSWRSIGEWPALTVEGARAEAETYAGLVAGGADPLAPAEEEKGQALSLGDFWHREFLPDAAGRWKPRTLAHHQWLWGNRIRDHLQHIPLAEIDAETLRRWHKTITADGPTVANGALRLVRSILTLAEQWGHIAQGTNPAALVRGNKERARDRFLSPQEVAILFQAIAAEESEGGVASVGREEVEGDRRRARETQSRGITAHQACLFRALLFTGCRKSELTQAQWHQVDLERGILTLDDAKAGRRIVSLAQPVVADLARLRPLRTSPWIFEGRVLGRPIVNCAKPWRRVCGRADAILAEERRIAEARGEALDSKGFATLRIHDCRHSAASTLISAGYSLGTVAAALGHRSLESVRRYGHLQPSVGKAAADALAELYQSARQGGKVIALRKEEDIAKEAEGSS